jgi:hypothetical protein
MTTIRPPLAGSIGMAERALGLMIDRVNDPSRKTFGKMLVEHGASLTRLSPKSPPSRSLADMIVHCFQAPSSRISRSAGPRLTRPDCWCWPLPIRCAREFWPRLKVSG